MVVYVDDINLTCIAQTVCIEVENMLINQFEMKFLGTPISA